MKFLTALLAVFICISTYAGEVNLNWDASVGATGYRIYTGVAPGVYGSPIEVDGLLTSSPVTVLIDGCVQQFIAMTAFNVLGESGFSTELTVFPRPVFLGQPALANNDTLIEINGGNFAPGITMTMNNQAVPFTVNLCTKISIPVATVPGLGQGQPVTIQLCNGSVCDSVVMFPVTTPQTVTAT